eukprot:gene19054-biopygen20500
MITSSSHLFAKDLLPTPRKKSTRPSSGRAAPRKKAHARRHARRPRGEKNRTRPLSAVPAKKIRTRPWPPAAPRLGTCADFFWRKSSRDDFWHRSLSPGRPQPFLSKVGGGVSGGLGQQPNHKIREVVVIERGAPGQPDNPPLAEAVPDASSAVSL